MDSDNLITILALIFLVACSAFFSATETAFSSFNRIRMKSMANEGNKKARLVLKLSDDYDRTISTILVGNNITNIASASIATVLFVNLLGSVGVSVSTVVTTVVVLIFGEITPKSLAKESPEKIAMSTARILSVVCFILTPINFVFAQWKKLVSKIFKTSDEQSSITEEELRTLVSEAEQEGAINPDDKEMIENALEFNDSKVVEILTPRVDIVALPKTASMDDVAEQFIETGYTRILIYEDSIDNIVGMVHLRDFFEATRKQRSSIEELITPVLYVSPLTKISHLLEFLRNNKIHIAVVTDEYGGTVGIATMEDILEELVGEIWDEHDEIQEEIQEIGENKYIIAGRTEIEDALELFDTTSDTDTSTVSGWVIEQIGDFPQEQDSFLYDGIEITIQKITNRHVDECIFERIAPSTLHPNQEEEKEPK